MNFLGVTSISKEIRGSIVLNEITIGQQQGWNIAIAGETGSGKSTLLKIIAGLVQPGSGEIFFQGVRVKGPDEKLIPGHPGIAYLSQQFELANNYRVEEVLEYANHLSEEEAGAI
ncbi:MAG: ATP-binding cassette domain-containing protein [Chitinophagaceae bacterium]